MQSWNPATWLSSLRSSRSDALPGQPASAWDEGEPGGALVGCKGRDVEIGLVKLTSDAAVPRSRQLETETVPMRRCDSFRELYREHVIGGPSSFLLAANGSEDFARAFRKKLVIEISAVVPPP